MCHAYENNVTDCIFHYVVFYVCILKMQPVNFFHFMNLKQMFIEYV